MEVRRVWVCRHQQAWWGVAEGAREDQGRGVQRSGVRMRPAEARAQRRNRPSAPGPPNTCNISMSTGHTCSRTTGCCWRDLLPEPTRLRSDLSGAQTGRVLRRDERAHAHRSTRQSARPRAYSPRLDRCRRDSEDPPAGGQNWYRRAVPNSRLFFNMGPARADGARTSHRPFSSGQCCRIR